MTLCGRKLVSAGVDVRERRGDYSMPVNVSLLSADESMMVAVHIT